MIKFMLLCTLIINIFPVNDSLDQSQDSQQSKHVVLNSV